MSITVSVGQFATMTHLSVKTLHHYHHVGLLEPVHVDSETGYRYYSLDQLPTAQLIRRLRDLRMPVADVRDVLVAQSPRDRESLITAHIDHLEAELAQTKAAVNSLRALLNNAASPQGVHRRAESTTPAVAITAIVDPTNIESWWRDALHAVREAVRTGGLDQTGPAGGTKVLLAGPGRRQHPGAGLRQGSGPGAGLLRGARDGALRRPGDDARRHRKGAP